MKLTDIAPLDKWVELEKEIHRKSGLNASVFDTDGIRITDFKKWPNKLCPVVKAHEKGQSYICAVAHQNIATQARQTKKPVIAECDGGLMKLVAPVFVGEAFLGVAGGCGHLLEGGEIETFMINKTIDLDEHQIEDLAGEVVTMSREEAESLLEFIRQEIEAIVGDFERKQHTAD